MKSILVLVVSALFLLPSCATLGPFPKNPTNTSTFTIPPGAALIAHPQRLTGTYTPFLLISSVKVLRPGDEQVDQGQGEGMPI